MDFTVISFDRPWTLLFIIPLLVYCLFFLRRGLYRDLSRTKRSFLLIVKLLLFSVLLIALASPSANLDALFSGRPYVKLIIDNSSSFDLFDRNAVMHVRDQLDERLDVDVVFAGNADYSPLGDHLLNHMRSGESILLVSDGWSNQGKPLDEAALIAAQQQTTINVLRLEPVQHDAYVEIFGPSKVTPNIESEFTVRVTGTMTRQHTVRFFVDDDLLLEKTTDGEISFKRQFDEGYHSIRAELDEQDYFKDNNIFYKTVKVVDKPPIFIYEEQPSQLASFFADIYHVDAGPILPTDLSEYYAIIINDIPAASVDRVAPLLEDFATEGNGVVVLGGESSYEFGEYKDSRFEKMLPVSVGSSKKKENANIVIAIDISGSTSAEYGYGSIADIGKAVALELIKNIKGTYNVGVLAFNNQAYIVSEISPLLDKKEDVLSKVASLEQFGDSYVPIGINESIVLLQQVGGGNVLFISDGKSGGISSARDIVAKASAQGIIFYGIGLGDSCVEYNDDGSCEQESTEKYGVEAIRSIALAGGGTFTHAEQAPERVDVLFGDGKEGTRTGYTIVLTDTHHFITQDLELSASLSGFNSFIPKSTAKLLATTDAGDPLLVVGRYGLGRIASFASDDGSLFANQLFVDDNSLFIVRAVNWAIGDPERKKEQFISIPDTLLGEATEVLYRGDKQPVSEEITFYKSDEGFYSGSFTPASPGVQTLFGATYAVNSLEEHLKLGLSPELDRVVTLTGGQFFAQEEINRMIEVFSAQSKRPVTEKEYFRWPFILAALILFLIDLFVRKLALQRNV